MVGPGRFLALELVPAVGLVAALSGCHTLPRGDPHRPDVVVISIDSLRPDHLSSYGRSRDTSPTLDRLAARGTRYTDAMSGSPWTLPAHLTMMTGLWPTEHLVIEDDRKLADNVPVIAERMRAAGYATAGFVSAVYLSGAYGFSRGFDTYEDYGLSEKASLAHEVRTPQLVAAALGWAKALPPDQPAFVFLHTYDVHYPYAPPEPWNERYNKALTSKELQYHNWGYYLTHPVAPQRMKALVAQYDESIRYVDDSLKPMVDTWSWDRDVVFIVTADHGEEFGERGSWGHAHTLYSEVLDIPLIVSGTGIPVAVRDERVGSIDLAATIAAIAGVEWGIGDGVDVRQPVADRPFWTETSRFKASVLGVVDGPTDRAMACIVDLAADPSAGAAVEHYNLWNDPGQKVLVRVPRDPLEQRIYGHLGQAWSAGPGTVTSDGALFQDQARVTSVAGPGRFGVWPPDATLTLTAPDLAGAGDAGPVAPASSVTFEGVRTWQARELTDEVRAQLEALGYTAE